MNNRPYEQDNGVLSTVLGTTLMAGAAYGSIYAMTDAKGFEASLTKIFNKIAPMETDIPDAYEARMLGAHDSIRQANQYASVRRDVSFAQSRQDKIALMKKMEAQPFAPIAMPSSFTPSAMSYHDFAYENLAALDSSQEGIGSKLVEAVNKIKHVKRKADGNFDVNFTGTTMKLQVKGNYGFEDLDIHLPKFDDRTKTWLSRDNGQTTRVHYRGHIRYQRDGNTYSKIGIKNPLEELLDVLQDPAEMMRNLDPNNIDYGRALLKGEGSTMSIESTRDLQQVLNTLTRDSGVYAPGNDIDKIRHLGRKYKISTADRIRSEDDFSLSVKNMSNGPATQSADVKRFYKDFPPILKNQTGLDLRFGGNQESVTEGEMIDNPRQVRFGQAEEFKSTSKTTPWNDNGLFESGKFHRTKPIIGNPTSRQPKVFNALLRLTPDTDEAMLLNPEITDLMEGVYRKELKYKNLASPKQLASMEESANMGIRYKRYQADGSLGEFEDANSVFDLFNDEFFQDPSQIAKKLERGVGNIGHIELGKGVNYGIGSLSDQLENMGAIAPARELAGMGSALSVSERFVLDHGDIERSVRSYIHTGEYVNGGSAMSGTLFGSYVAPVNKIGSNVMKTRNNVQHITNKLRGVDGSESWNNYKGIFPRNGVIGKNGTEYISFLQESIAGHVMGARGNVTLGTGARDLLKGFTNIDEVLKIAGEGNSKAFSLKWLFEKGGLQFNQLHGEAHEQVDFAQKFLATVMTVKKIQNTNFVHDTSTAADIVTQNFNLVGEGKYSWDVIKGIQANEIDAQSLGMGYNQKRMGLKELHYYKDQTGILKEIMSYNSINSSKIWEHGQLMMDSLADKTMDLKKIMPNISIKGSSDEILSMSDTMHQMFGPGGRSNMSNPEVLLNSPLASEEINPNGFGIKYYTNAERTEQATAFAPGAEFFGATQYLGDEDRAIVTSTQNAWHKFLSDAHNNEGVASHTAFKELSMSMMREHGSNSQKGFYKYGAAHIELANYNKNVSIDGWLNNQKVIDAAPEELRNVMSNTALISKDQYQKTLEKQLEDHTLIARSKNITFAEHAKDFFGEGSAVHEYASRGLSHKEIAKNMTDLSVSMGQRMQRVALGKGKDGELEQLLAWINTKSSTVDVTRWPVIYKGSTAWGVAIAADEHMMGKGKKIALGNTLRTLMNADHDGDAIMTLLMHSNAARQNTMREIGGSQKLSSDMLNMLKNSKGNHAMFNWSAEGIEKAAFKAPRTPEELKTYVSKVEELGAVDTALASFMTKATAGSSDVATMGIRAYFAKQHRAKFNPKEMEELDTFVSNFFPLTVIQESLSGKHIEKPLGPLQSRLHAIMTNIGDVSKDDFIMNMKVMKGELDPMSVFTLFKARAENVGWAREAFPHASVLYDVQKNLRTVTEDQFINAHKYFHNDQDAAQKAWDFRKSYLESLTPEEATPIMERSELLKKANIGLEELFHASNSHARDTINPYVAMSRAARKLGPNASSEEMMAEVMANFGTRHMGEMSKSGFEMMTGNVGLISKRSLVGLRASVNFIKEHMTLPRAAGLAGLAMIGTTALNIVFGDATPMSPNDLPSVNNPSFRDNRYNNMLENRQLNNIPNANVSSGLLTDSHNSYDSIMDHLQSNFGNHYSSVSVRHDGQDPYKEQMMRYNM